MQTYVVQTDVLARGTDPRMGRHRGCRRAGQGGRGAESEALLPSTRTRPRGAHSERVRDERQAPRFQKVPGHEDETRSGGPGREVVTVAAESPAHGGRGPSPGPGGRCGGRGRGARAPEGGSARGRGEGRRRPPRLRARARARGGAFAPAASSRGRGGPTPRVRTWPPDRATTSSCRSSGRGHTAVARLSHGCHTAVTRRAWRVPPAPAPCARPGAPPPSTHPTARGR